MEDLERYLDEIVDPTIKEFEQNPTSVRHAFLACVATFHSVDYLAYDRENDRPRKGRVGNLRKKFGEQSVDFYRIDQIAHAFKHVVSDGQSKVSAKEVVTRPAGFLDVSFYYDVSRYDDPVGGVTLNNNRNFDVLEILKNAMAFLRSVRT